MNTPPKERVCEFGVCTIAGAPLPVAVWVDPRQNGGNLKWDRHYFCCEYHAAKWLWSQKWQHYKREQAQ